jgi:hypothetical protein
METMLDIIEDNHKSKMQEITRSNEIEIEYYKTKVNRMGAVFEDTRS